MAIDFKYATHKSKLKHDIIELQRKKDLDYGSAFDKTFQIFGKNVILIRLYDKFNRFERLSNSNEHNIKEESIIDTIIDISCYAVLGIMSLTKNYSFEEIFIDAISGPYEGCGMDEAKRCYNILLNNKDTYTTSSYIDGLKEICFWTFNYISRYTYENKGKI